MSVSKIQIGQLWKKDGTGDIYLVTRLYSEADIERLRLIQQLTNDVGLNLVGVEHVLELQDQVARMRRTLDRMEREGTLVVRQEHLGLVTAPPRPVQPQQAQAQQTA